MRIIYAIVVACLVSGCALVEDKVPVNYVAPVNLSVANGASNVTVTVSGEDDRSANRDRISTKKNGYGIEMAKITSTNDVVELVRSAVETELGSLGFKVGPGGIVVNVQLETFYNDFKPGFFSADAVAEVSFTVTAKAPDGSLVYSRSYKGIGMNKNIALASGDNAAVALQEGLTNAVAQMIQDETMQKALVAAGQKTTVRPVSDAKPQS
jgi:uncharacterized lipoprotein